MNTLTFTFFFFTITRIYTLYIIISLLLLFLLLLFCLGYSQCLLGLIIQFTVLLWAPAQRKRATMLYFANVLYLFIYLFFMAAFSGPGEQRFAKVLQVVDLECH